MTEWLVKRFVKNPEKTDDSRVRESYGILASLVGIVLNVLLFGMKLAIGLIIHSISVMADGFNNLSDAASGIISFAGVKLSNRPADREHPFGHGRYEYIAALVVSFLVLQVGFDCLKSSFDKILHPEQVKASFVLMGILVLSILVKVWLGLFNRKLSRKIHSSVMKATAADAFGDVLITSATVASVAVSTMTGWKIDGFVGLLVSVFVLLAGFHIAKDTLEPLLGKAATREEYEKITQFVEGYEGIVGSHDLIVHNYGPSYTMATIHAEVPRDTDISASHEIIDRIEREALRELGIFLVIHMDPIEVNDETVTRLKGIVGSLVNELEKEASIHDFRMVNGEKQINLIFDLIVPFSYSEKQEEELVGRIKEKVSLLDGRYQCVISAEHSFVAR